MFTTPPNLVNFNGKHISAICPFSIGKDDSQNHCAHFVSHAMGYDFSTTCKNFTFDDKQADGAAANIRVNELFNRCSAKGEWDTKSDDLKSCLIFVTRSGNMEKLETGLVMKRSRKKHVGIFVSGTVWNYSNAHEKVVADDLLTFKKKFSASYRTPGDVVSFYYAEFMK
jgi:hypothetical protein